MMARRFVEQHSNIANSPLNFIIEIAENLIPVLERKLKRKFDEAL
jgi:hypothetical protein